MNLFRLEEYLTQYEFSAPYLLCCSDAESFSMQEIVALGSNDDQQLWQKLRLSYTETFGHPILRETIAKALYPNLLAENILCFAGAEEGIFASLYTLLNESDHAIVITPCYQSLLEIPLLKGATVTQIELKEEQQWRINIDEIKRAITKNTKCVVMNFPHNPSGQIISQEDQSALVRLCDGHGIWLFADEVYRLLGKPKMPWANPAAVTYNKGISLGVMSKAFGMAGLRIGWIACQDKKMLHTIKQMKDYLSICNSAPAEILSIIALNNKEAILKRNNDIVANNLGLLDVFFAEYKNLFSWVRSEGGCVGFVRYLADEPIEIFCKRAVEKAGVLLLPASIYDVKTNHFRIGFGRKNMHEALDAFRKFLQ
jgi:aspartate/methionine/tyrosine aminotransferase